jgi:hypothetical protein
MFIDDHVWNNFFQFAVYLPSRYLWLTGALTTSTGVACDSHLTGPSHLRGRVLFGDPEWLSFVWKMVHQAILTSET